MKISTLNQKKTSVSIPKNELTKIIRNYLVRKRFVSKYGTEVIVFIGGTGRKLESIDVQVTFVVNSSTKVDI